MGVLGQLGLGEQLLYEVIRSDSHLINSEGMLGY